MMERLEARKRRIGASLPFACLILILGATACGGSGDGDSSPEDVAPAPRASAPVLPAGLVRAASAKGNFDVTIVPDGGKFPLNQPFGVTVALLEPGTDAPLTNFDGATIDARMPAHGHGMNHDVELVRRPDGSFRAEGLLLHMIGRWEIHVDVARGPKVERAQTSVNLRL